MVEVALRWMVVDDADRYAKMAYELWPQLSFDQHLAEIKPMLIKSKKRRGALASLPNEPNAGFADISIRDYVNGCTQTPVPMLEGIWVRDSCRRHGVGQALVNFITAWAKEEGYVEICSDADIENIISHKSHTSWGFE